MPIYKTLTPLRHTNTPKIVQLKVQGYVELVSTNAGANILSAVSIAWCNGTIYDGDPAQGASTLVLGPDSVGRWRSVVSQYDQFKVVGMSLEYTPTDFPTGGNAQYVFTPTIRCDDPTTRNNAAANLNVRGTLPNTITPYD